MSTSATETLLPRAGSLPSGHAVLRLAGLLLPFLFVAACETAPAPPPRSVAARPASPAAPSWRAVPARADGAYVPGGRRHIIKRGETGFAIAAAYGVSWARIAAANNIAPDATLYTGRPLFIPTGTPAPRPAATAARPTPAAPPATSAPSGSIEQRAAAFSVDIDDLIAGSQPATPPPQTASTSSPAGPAPAATTAGVAPRLQWPVGGRTILSTYGAKPGGRFNDGINIKTRAGEPVHAAASGEVIYIGDAISSFGLLVILRHPGGLTTVYGHLSDALVSRGSKVSRGQAIAEAGATGIAREPQLLFEVRQGRKAINPLNLLPS